MPSNCTSNLTLFLSPSSLFCSLTSHFSQLYVILNLSFLPCISSPFLSLPHVLPWPGIGPPRNGRAETCKAKLRPSKLNTCLTMDFLEVLQSTHMQVSFIVASTFVMVLVVCFCPPYLFFFLFISSLTLRWSCGLAVLTGPCPLAELLIFMNFSHHICFPSPHQTGLCFHSPPDHCHLLDHNWVFYALVLASCFV